MPERSATTSRRGRTRDARPIGTPMLAVLVLVSAIAPLSTDTYLPALPEVARSLGSGPAAVQLTLTTFLIGLAVGQLVIGPLSDRIGRRTPLLVGTLACALANLGCALAPGVWTLVVARFLAGAAGAAGVVIARAVVADRARGIAAARVFAVMAAVQGLAPVLSPLAGGALAPVVGWRGIFGVLTTVTTVMAVGAVLLVPESLPPSRRSTGPVRDVARSLLAVAADRAFLAPASAFAFTFGVLFSYIAASPFVLQGLVGLSPGRFSLSFAANAVGLTVSSAVAARLVGRFGPRRLLGVGVVALAGCSVALLVVALLADGAMPGAGPLSLRGGAGRVALLALLFGTSVAVGQVFGNATSLALAAAGTRAGAGSAVLGAGQFAVGGLASPLVGLGGTGTAVPMAVTMTGSALLATVAVALGGRGAPRSSVGVPDHTGPGSINPRAAL